MTYETDMATMKKRMEGALKNLTDELGGLRTGRASTGLLDSVVVEAYGQTQPLNQVAGVTVADARQLVVKVWDKTNLQAVEKAIHNADLGVSPVCEGEIIRVPVPALTEERRTQMARVAHRYAEQARVAVRNVRRDFMEKVKKGEKDGEFGKDESKAHANNIQAITDQFIGSINEALGKKETDIRTI